MEIYITVLGKSGNPDKRKKPYIMYAFFNLDFEVIDENLEMSRWCFGACNNAQNPNIQNMLKRN